MNLKLFLLFVQVCVWCGASRSYRRSKLNISVLNEPFVKSSPDSSVKSKLIAATTAPWVKPMAIASAVFLLLAVIILSTCPEGPEYESLRELALWVFSIPLGTLVVCMLLVSVLQLLSLVYDKAKDALKNRQFELVFLAILLAVIITAYCYIAATKTSNDNVDDSNFIVTWMAAPWKPVFGNVLRLVIISDYLYICAEWLKKNHLTIFGFALLICSFYLFYILP